MENFHPIFTLHISCFCIQGTPKNMICHYFLQEGGGSSLDHLFIIYVVIIGLRREGGKPNLHVFIKYTVFIFGRLPLGLPKGVVEEKSGKAPQISFVMCYHCCESFIWLYFPLRWSSSRPLDSVTSRQPATLRRLTRSLLGTDRHHAEPLSTLPTATTQTRIGSEKTKFIFYLVKSLNN